MIISLKDYDEYKKIFSGCKLIRSGNSNDEFWIDLYELEEDGFYSCAAVTFENPDGYYKNIEETGHMIICNDAGEQDIKINAKYFKWKNFSFDDVCIGDVLLDLEDNMLLIVDKDIEEFHYDDYYDEYCDYYRKGEDYRYYKAVYITNVEEVKNELCNGIEYSLFKDKYHAFDIYEDCGQHSCFNGVNFEDFELIRIDRINLKRQIIIKTY